MRACATLLVFGLGCQGRAPGETDGSPGDTVAVDTAETVGVDADGDGWAVGDDDCNDLDADVNPGAVESCNQRDDDCDGDVDEGAIDARDWYADGDGDGFGIGEAVVECDAPEGFVEDSGDCDDSDSNVSPAAQESCATPADDDCDGVANEDDAADAGAWVPDADGDGYGDAHAAVTRACEAPEGMVAGATDCDDADAATHPGAHDACEDGVDSDCTGADLSCPWEGDYPATAAALTIDGEGWDDRLSCASAGEGDLDGDGTPDLVVSSPGIRVDSYATTGGRTYVFFDALSLAPSASADSADLTIEHEGPGSDYFGTALLTEADVTGDGANDLIVSALYEEDIAGRVRVFEGPLGPGSLSSSAATAVLSGAEPDGQAGSEIEAGDINGDGIDDLVASAPYAAGWDGEAYVVFGPIVGDVSFAAADITLAGSTASNLGGLGVADVDGDGRHDVWVGEGDAKYGGLAVGDARLFLSSTLLVDGSSAVEDAVIYGATEGGGFGGLDVGMDVDGSGRPDLLVKEPVYGAGFLRPGAAWLFYDPPTSGTWFAETDADVKLQGVDGEEDGAAFAKGLGDVNSDGFDDILVGAPDHDVDPYGDGSAYLFYGPIGHDVTRIVDGEAGFHGEVRGGLFWPSFRARTRLGDLDADGFDDFMLADPNNGETVSEAGRLYVFLGGP